MRERDSSEIRCPVGLFGLVTTTNFVPGVIAFAVDLTTGAIYLPQGQKSKVGQMLGQVEIRQYDWESRDLDEIVAFVEAETGLPLDRDSLRVIRGRPEASIESRLRELNAQIAVGRSRELRADG